MSDENQLKQVELIKFFVAGCKKQAASRNFCLLEYAIDGQKRNVVFLSLMNTELY